MLNVLWGLVTDGFAAAGDFAFSAYLKLAPLPFSIHEVRGPIEQVTLARFRSEAEALVLWRHVSAALAAVRDTPVTRVELYEHGRLRRVIARGVMHSTQINLSLLRT